MPPLEHAVAGGADESVDPHARTHDELSVAQAGPNQDRDGRGVRGAGKPQGRPKQLR